MSRSWLRRARSASIALALLGMGALLGQASSGCGPAPQRPLPEFAPQPRHAEKPLIAVIAPQAPPVAPLLRSLRAELAADFDVAAIAVDRDSTTASLARALDTEKPQALVLVDNSAAELYAPLASSSPAPLPAVIVMASFVEALQRRVPNSTAIAFEPPAVTTLSEVRNLLSRPVARAGVVYRRGFEGFVLRDQDLSRRAQIELLAEPVPAEPSSASLGRALRRLEHEQLDALWVSNDNVLLSKRLLSSAWLPFAKKSALPIVVGVPALVQSAVPLGMYAAVPDTVGLGAQTADLIYALQKRSWHASGAAVQPPLAVKTYLNLTRARALGVPSENERLVDVLLREGESP